MLKEIKTIWKSYRYRFTPWQAVNFDRHAVSLREQHQVDNLESLRDDGDLLNDLSRLLSGFRPPEYVWMYRNCPERRREFMLSHAFNTDVLFRDWGFQLTLRPSRISGAGQGVFVVRGKIKRGQIVALYPGTVYLPYQPILFPSIGNPYIFKCADGTLVDGKANGLSGMIFRSCHGRDRIGSVMPVSDVSWMEVSNKNLLHLINPLNIGQIVNNCNKEFPANVAYHELNVHIDNFKTCLRPFLPNVNYGGNTDDLKVRIVPLIATKDIGQDEELFSTYFTIVNKT